MHGIFLRWNQSHEWKSVCWKDVRSIWIWICSSIRWMTENAKTGSRIFNQWMPFSFDMWTHFSVLNRRQRQHMHTIIIITHGRLAHKKNTNHFVALCFWTSSATDYLGVHSIDSILTSSFYSFSYFWNNIQMHHFHNIGGSA